MLCPEVWKFSSPESNFKEQKGKLQSENRQLLPPPLSEFHYSHLVSVILPNISAPPQQIKNSLTVDGDYYKVANISLSTLLSNEFIDKFIKNGSLTALSVNTRIDTDNCVCLTPSGDLILSLDKLSYQELGLEGEVSHFATKKKDRYTVKVSLTTLSKSHQNRAKECFSRRLHNFTLILSWTPPADTICPSTIAKHFSDSGCEVSVCAPKFKCRTERNVEVPALSGDASGDELAEWMGMFSLGADLKEGKFDAYLNTYECPENNFFSEYVTYLEWRGFFTAGQVQKLYEQLVKQTNSPWVSLYVQGFSDAPIAWKTQENHFFTNGDNAYAIFLQPDGNYLTCIQSCTNKRHK